MKKQIGFLPFLIVLISAAVDSAMAAMTEPQPPVQAAPQLSVVSAQPGRPAWLVATGFDAPNPKWSPSQATQNDFDRVLKSLIERELSKRNSSTFVWNDDRRTRCAHIPMHPRPDRHSKSQAPLAWYLEIDSGENPINKQDRNQQIKQLEALVTAGVLEKRQTTNERDGMRITGARYSLTIEGWKWAVSDKPPFCIMYGDVRYLGVSAVESKLISQRAGLEIYTVTAKMGVENPDALAPWARLPEVQAAFPEIKRMVQGEEFQRQFIRGGNEWIPYECLQYIIMRKVYEQQCDETLAAGDKSQALLDPKLLKQNRFAVEIRQYEEEAASQIEALPPEKKEEMKRLFYAHLEELKNLPPPTEEEIKNLIRSKNEQGWASVEFIGLKIYFNKGYRYKYRIALSYKLPPGRTIDPNILRHRGDLRAMIENGKACAGDFGFDLEMRDSQAGSGSCWDAVDISKP